MAGRAADPRRALLLELFQAALAAVEGRRRVRAALAHDPDGRPCSVLAVGKAAAAMMLGARDALGARLGRGLAIAPADGSLAALAADPAIRCLEGSHPLPDERSLAAGEAMLAFAAATAPGSRVLLLVSGGASALADAPAPGVTLAGLRELTARALAEGWDIARLNAARRERSRLKGGRLVECFRDCDLHGLLISDVAGDDPAVAASGLLASPRCRVIVVARLADALDAAERAARAQGLDVRRAAARLAGPAPEAAARICHELAAIPEALLIAGGETTVRLPATPGRGGRCQHLALAAAGHIAGHDDYLLLAAGTDGQDGASDDAGAIVDGGTLARIADAGLDAAAGLAAADSGTLLEAAGDLLYTGATGTNVGDVVLALRLPPSGGDAL